MKITVLHNLSPDAGFGLNQVFETDAEGHYAKRAALEPAERHPLVKVFEYDADPPATAVTGPDAAMALLEAAFFAFNVGSDELAERYRARRLRSLSVGDVLVLGEIAYQCDSAGWSAVPAEHLRILDAYEADPVIRERFQYGPRDQLAISVPWEAS